MMRLDTAASPAFVLTPRQDRLEGAIQHGLRTRTTRSELRESVHQLVDLFRLQGVAPDDGVRRIQTLAMRAMITTDAPDTAGETAAERVAMVVQWACRRYGRGD